MPTHTYVFSTLRLRGQGARRLAQGGLRNLCMQVFGPYVGCHLAWRPAAACRICLRSGTAISGGALDTFVCLGFLYVSF